MDASLRFLARRPPRTGWILFFLALAAVLILPSMLAYSSLEFSSGPMLVAVIAGLLFGLVGLRRLRALLIIPALVLPFVLMELAPPLRIIVGDIRALLHFSGPRPPLLVPQAVSAALSATETTLTAAWAGDTDGLNWAVAHLAALLGYLAAALLGVGLRRGSRPIAWSLPLMGVIAATGITARSGTTHIVIGVFLTLLVGLVGGFVSRERNWERQGVGFSDLLRWDVTAFGAALLAIVILFGLITPAASHNLLTTWLWTDVKLPEGLARLDKPDNGLGNGGGDFRIGSTRPGEDLELGRSLEEGNRTEVALTVRAPRVLPASLPYWRGRIFDSYTGRGWTTGPIHPVPVQPMSLGRIPPELVPQEIVDRHDGRKLRYGVPDIVSVDHTSTLEEGSLGGSVGWTGTETTYTVYSQAPAPLTEVGPQAIETQKTLAAYMTLPSGMPSRVVELAERVTQGAGTQTARAAALETYLRDLQYSYAVAPLKPGGDAVDQFLFTMRSGYCTYYASAMAVMARIVGIPSRVAVGYATGTFDPASGAFVVHEADAHAWPELYIDGQGWTRWEPTPIRPVPARSTSPGQSAPVFEPAPAREPALRGLPWWPVLAAIAGLALLIVVGRLRRLATPMGPAGVHRDLYRFGRRAGIPFAAGDSIEEYAGRLARAIPRARQPIERVARLLTARLYREEPLSPGEERSLVSAWYTVRSIFQRRADRL